MGLFKKEKGVKEYGTERLFKEAVREINELYDDVKAEHTDTDAIISDFSKLLESIKVKLDDNDAKKLEDFALRLKKINNCSKNTVRDIRDVLRNHKKRLAEIRRERE